MRSQPEHPQPRPGAGDTPAAPGPAGWEADGSLITLPPDPGPSSLFPARERPEPAGLRYRMDFTSTAAPLARLQVTIGAARTGAREYAITAQRAHLLYDACQHGTETARAVMTSVLGPPASRDETLDAAADLAAVLHAAGFPWSAWDGTEAGFPPGAVIRHARTPPGGEGEVA